MEESRTNAKLPRSRRTRTACAFCRHRKLRCDGTEPQCSTCVSYGQECQYITRPAKKRPTNSRIRELEEQNKRLAAQLKVSPTSKKDQPAGNPQDDGESSDASSNGPTSPSHQAHDLDQAHSRPIQSTPVEPSNKRESGPGGAAFYGLTSTLFDPGAAEAASREASTSKRSRVPEEWIQKGLIAEATHQRQLEMVNYHAGKLDFDGVDPDLGMHLLSLHWARQHHSFLITYRPAFMRDMACGGPYFSKLLLNAIFFSAAKFSPRMEVRRDPNDVRTAGWRFRKRVREILSDSMDKSEITTIQALLVMTNSLFALGDERSAAWMYAGIATRMIIDLGMHVNAEQWQSISRLSDEDLEIRRRVFWGAFVVDKVQSLYQGRPASLQNFDVRVPLKFLDTYEEFEHWMPHAHIDSTQDYRGSPSYSVSTFSALCKLSVIMNDILNKVYSESSRQRPPLELIVAQKELHAELEAWDRNLPPQLKFQVSETSIDVPPPHVFSLLAMYHVLLVLLHRPFVSEGHLHTDEPKAVVKSFSACVKAATAIVRLVQMYDRIFSIRRAPYLIAYAIYVAATILVRVAAQKGPSSNAHSMLQFCFLVFDGNLETNFAVKIAKAVIVNLMKRMNLNMESVTGRNSNGESSTSAPPTSTSTMQPRSTRSRGPSLPTAQGQTPHSQGDQDFDIDIIIQSFGDQDMRMPQLLPIQAMTPGNSMQGQMDHTGGSMNQNNFFMPIEGSFDYPMLYDPLFGFNGSIQDAAWLNDPQTQNNGF